MNDVVDHLIDIIMIDEMRRNEMLRTIGSSTDQPEFSYFRR